MLRDRAFVAFLVASVGITYVYLQSMSVLALHAKAEGLSTSDYGLLVSLNGLLVVVLELPIASVTQRLDARRVIAAGFFVTGLGFALTAFAGTMPLLAATVVLWTIGEVVDAPVSSAYVAQLAPEHMRGRYMGAWGLTWSLGLMLAPSLGARSSPRPPTPRGSPAGSSAPWPPRSCCSRAGRNVWRRSYRSGRPAPSYRVWRARWRPTGDVGELGHRRPIVGERQRGRCISRKAVGLRTRAQRKVSRRMATSHKEVWPMSQKFVFPAPFARRLPDPVFKDPYGIERHIMFVPVTEVPEGLPLDANARVPNIRKRVYKDIEASLLNENGEPGTFHLKHKGITIVASKVEQRDDKYVVTIEDEGQGILDGGHTYTLITKERGLAPLPQNWVKFEVLTNIPPEWIPEIAGGLNTSVQVQPMSLDNLAHAFDWIKSELQGSPTTT